MSLKEKKYKYVEDLIEDYISLSDEQIEIPLAIQKAKKKQENLFEGLDGEVLKKDDSEDLFKVFSQIKKIEERKTELQKEFTEVENLLKEFLASINGQQLSYEKKDDVEKIKITYLFWLEDGNIKCNR